MSENLIEKIESELDILKQHLAEVKNPACCKFLNERINNLEAALTEIRSFLNEIYTKLEDIK